MTNAEPTTQNVNLNLKMILNLMLLIFSLINAELAVVALEVEKKVVEEEVEDLLDDRNEV